jgi:hypothetical protein
MEISWVDGNRGFIADGKAPTLRTPLVARKPFFGIAEEFLKSCVQR